MSKQVVVIGSIAYDYIMQFPGHFNEHILPEHIDRLSLSFLVDEMRKARGGSGANIAYSMGILGGNPLLFATAGQDFGDYGEWLQTHGVDTSGVTVLDDKFTASFFVNTDLGNRQIATFYAGAMGQAGILSLHDLNQENIAFVCISPTAPNAMQKAVRECKELGIPFVYDPSQQTVRLSSEELREGIEGSTMLIVNDYELSLIEKKTGLTSAEIGAMTGTLIVTRGEEGVSIIDGHETIHVNAAPAHTIGDPTGLGDAFRGGFFRARLGGADWDTAGKVGALAATYCLESWSPQAEYTTEEFVTRFDEVYGGADAVRAILVA